MWVSHNVKKDDVQGHFFTAAKIGALVGVSTKIFTPLDPMHAAIYGIITSLVMSIIGGYEPSSSEYAKAGAWIFASLIAIPITMCAGVPFAANVAIPIQMSTLLMTVFLFAIKEFFKDKPEEAPRPEENGVKV